MKALSDPQKRLPAEIADKGGLYISRWSRYTATVRVLQERGLIRCDERDMSSNQMDHYVAIEPR